MKWPNVEIGRVADVVRRTPLPRRHDGGPGRDLAPRRRVQALCGGEDRGPDVQEAPFGVETGALLEPGTEAPRCWWATRKAIAENEYNLAAGRYKPLVTQKPPDEDPAELIREVLDIEKEIIGGLGKLLEDVEGGR